MRRLLFAYFTLFSVLPSLYAQSISIVESRAEIQFLFVDDDVDGSLSNFKFNGAINLDDLANSDFSGSVAMETLDTDNWFRDRHLRSKKYFNNKTYPLLTFKSTSVSGAGSKFLVRGNLTIKGISRPVTFNFRTLPGKLQGTAQINTSQFDIMIHDDTSRNLVEVTITLPYTAL